jgi:TrmH family RNA methyltransferase
LEVITSPQNAKIKQARALRQRKHRQASGTFLVEGIRHVGEAVEADAAIEAVFYAPELLQSEFAFALVERLSSRGVPVFAVGEQAFASLAEKENPTGILAIVQMQPAQLDELNPSSYPLGVAVIAPQDPGNIGAILRTVDATGFSGLILLDRGADPYHPSTVRASMGALFWHPVVPASFDDFSHWVKMHGYHVYGTSARGNRDYREIERYQMPALLLLGSEREGLTDRQAALCDEILRLPMYGRVTSLNLAVAAGILMYAMTGDLNKDS